MARTNPKTRRTDAENKRCVLLLERHARRVHRRRTLRAPRSGAASRRVQVLQHLGGVVGEALLPVRPLYQSDFAADVNTCIPPIGSRVQRPAVSSPVALFLRSAPMTISHHTSQLCWTTVPVIGSRIKRRRWGSPSKSNMPRIDPEVRSKEPVPGGGAVGPSM